LVSFPRKRVRAWNHPGGWNYRLKSRSVKASECIIMKAQTQGLLLIALQRFVEESVQALHTTESVAPFGV
jgi:hypothetical protein